jgi:DNA-binding response OmpR family regulator
METNDNRDSWKYSVRFLVVDDEVPVRKLIINRLKKEGYNGITFEASDGKEALDIFYEKDVDCIISDWNMPGINGIEFVEKVRNSVAAENLAIIMVTAESSMGKMEQAIESGIDDYLVKPFTPEDFKRKIDKALEKIKKKKMGA